MKPVLFHRLAKQELLDAATYYQGERAGLGGEFRQQFEAEIGRIQWNPLIYATEEVSEARLALLRQFTLYAIVFLVLETHIWVVAVANQRRRPRYWSRRLPK